MGGIFGGGGTVSTADTRLGSIVISQSTYGIVIPVVFGMARVSGNMIDYVDFTAIPHTTRTRSGGKGGGGGVTTEHTTYTYEAAAIFSLCEGPIRAVKRIWRDKNIYSNLADIRMEAFLGNDDQRPWAWMQGKYPERAISYPNTAYVASPNLELSSSGNTPTLNYEVAGRSVAPGRDDAAPIDIIRGILCDAQIGVNFPEKYLADATQFSNYCRVNGIYFSPAYDNQAEAHELISALLQASNSAPVWSQGQLKFVPYGLARLEANGVTYTPPVAPLYDITYDDLVYEEGTPPVVIKPNLAADRYNMQSIEILNRKNDYNVEPIKATDDADISQRGIRPADNIEMHFITLPDVAQFAAQSILQRKLYVVAQYEFTLTWRHCLLDPMDVVTITDPLLGLDRYPVRIISIEEDDELNLKITAEDCPDGVNSPTVYTTQAAERPKLDYNVPAANINEPVIFEPPAQLAEAMSICMAVSGKRNVWSGANVWASYDGDTYKKIGVIEQPARHGTLLEALKHGYSNDTHNALVVDVSMSCAELMTATAADAENNNTLCYVDGELISYETAELIGEYRYRLTKLRRGVYGTKIKEHPANSKFARIDDAVSYYKYRAEDIGKRFYLKFTSFNIFGNNEQSLADVEPYIFTIHGADAIEKPAFTVVQNGESLIATLAMNINSASDIYYKYELRFGTSWETGRFIDRFTSNIYTFRAPEEGTLTFWLKAIDGRGNYSKEAGRAIVSVVDLPRKNILYEKQSDLSDANIAHMWRDDARRWWIEELQSIGEYQHFSDIFGGNVFVYGDAEIVLPVIDLGENIIDSSCYYIGHDGVIHTLSVEKISDFEHFADIFGAHLTLMKPEFAKQIFNGVSVEYETRGAAYMDIRYRTSFDQRSWGTWKNISDAQFIGRYIEISILPRSSDGIGNIGISNVKVIIDVPDLEEIVEKVYLQAERYRLKYRRSFTEVRSVALYVQDGQGQQATGNILEQTSTHIDICILDANGDMIPGLLQKAVIRGY